ncbi:general substrate transporter [Pseudomassariella vexata]|uniref:General substrate transporter n=1 Tax=Pseudomassariella vexata TaxID=1141098 RepID=A0A1Y2EKL1_9PEZI|nr:general substrate transporter [Pseudomassariella vexata]ORY71385.1 general substrate transporter [Pseudomassariella vexata]
MIPKYVLASIAVSVGGLLNGYDAGGIGAITVMPEFEKTFGKLSPSVVNFAISLTMLARAFPATCVGHLIDRTGRLRAMIIGGVMFGISATIHGTAMTLAQFLVGRALSRLGEGLYVSNVSVYIAEIAPVKSRGVLACLPQFIATAVVCVGYFTAYGSVEIPSSMVQHLPYVVQVSLTFALVGSCLPLPDSPGWLISYGKRAESIHALERPYFSLV